MNKILSLFGLIKIKRAKKLTLRLHLYYVQCVANEVEKDFGKKAAVDVLQDAGKWWNEEFEWITQFNTNGAAIHTKPEFVSSEK